MNDNYFFSALEINDYPIVDFLQAYNIPFIEQIGFNRHYVSLKNGSIVLPPITVNMKRNEWICRTTGQGGQLSDLADLSGIISDEDKGNYIGIFSKMFYMYSFRHSSPKHFAIIPIRYGKSTTKLMPDIDIDIYRMMSRKGISMDTVGRWCSVILLHDRKTGDDILYPAFPCDNGDYYMFDGKSFRPQNNPSISTFGEIQKNQNCYVYENPMDFLAMMEIRHRNGVDALFKKDYHLVVNGDRNIEQAVQFLKDNPDFGEVRTILPECEEGEEMFDALNSACRGSIVNCNDIFKGYASLSDKVGIQLPNLVKKVLDNSDEKRRRKELGLPSEEEKKDEKEEEKVKEKNLNTKPRGFGKKQTIIIKDERHGLKM